ncbi:hypothetical protein RhiXN_07250 [Rhizoctonia solani]|uniref:Uncharacterized protein n=1 Tax=Rhizoctonia solani TaxID=456999 RepID=A0A8H8T0E1_9AGAM|nr:uncharacterized protein RhiXN_07250 [Rhizoctonia solani]QRW25301.1 hypothetical protein RhiXN_07250 [Rhizoctonia solani]
MRYKTAVLVGVWTETALWGVFFILYLICAHVLVRKQTLHTIQWIPLSTASLLFMLATIHLALQLRKVYEGLVLCANEPGGPDAYFLDISRWLNVAADGVYITMILVGDLVVIHRCFLIWGNRIRIIILPFILVLCTAGYAAVWLFTKLPPNGTALEGPLAKCTTITFLLSLATNILTTGLISYRILSTARKVASSVDVRPYMGGLAVVIESAAIYTTALVIYLVVYISRTNAQYIVFCALCPIIGIVPTLIIVRVGLGLTRTSQVDIEGPPSAPSPTYDIYSPTDAPILHITHLPPSYSPGPRSPHTRDFSGSDATWTEGPDAIRLQLRYSQGSVGRSIAPDDISRNSSVSFGLVRTKTTETKK